MKNVSINFAMAENIYKAALHHKSTCNIEDCGVHLFLLQATAKDLLKTCDNSERLEASDWKWPK